jgi:radical SAM superfamily enzyme YgiQ (UPF0313 family)
MKISISYPPIINDYGQTAMVSQNRNVQYFKKPTYLLPVIHAQAASLLKKNDYDVFWDDGNADMLSFENWVTRLVEFNPDLIVLESTTPVMKFMWKVTDKLKKLLPNSLIVMTGYHSMRSPHETLLNSSTDIVIKSNHVDFMLLRLCDHLKKTPNLPEINLDGITIKINNDIKDFGSFRLTENIEDSEIIDRDLVKWKNYAYENGNFLRTPGTYATSVIRDCLFGKCVFCRYNGPELSFSSMSIKKSVDEYEKLINKYNVKEIFDDSGVWYRGKDAIEFAKEIIKRGLHKKNCYFGINTRFEYLDEESIKWLAKANFRFILIGLESGSDHSLTKLDKGYTAEGVISNLKLMTKYGLHPHLTIMVGYYWETKKMLKDTIDLVKKIMFKGYARTLQVTLCTPLDFTPYHLDVINKKIILTNNYDDHDMSKIIVQTPEPHDLYYNAVKELYSIAFHPKFIFRQLLFLFYFRKRDWEFLFTYGVRAIRRVRQHIFNLTRNSSIS